LLAPTIAQMSGKVQPAGSGFGSGIIGDASVDRAAKQALVTTMHQVFNDTGLVVVAHNNGMVAAQSADFRKKVKEAGGKVRVVKNNLAKLALKDTEFAGIIGLFKGPTVLAYSKDPIAAARAASAYAKTNDKLVIIGGAMGNTVLDAKGVKALADLPSLDELRRHRPKRQRQLKVETCRGRHRATGATHIHPTGSTQMGGLQRCKQVQIVKEYVNV
jgi:large subunit ribosomal protein L10